MNEYTDGLPVPECERIIAVGDSLDPDIKMDYAVTIVWKTTDDMMKYVAELEESGFVCANSMIMSGIGAWYGTGTTGDTEVFVTFDGMKPVSDGDELVGYQSTIAIAKKS